MGQEGDSNTNTAVPVAVGEDSSGGPDSSPPTVQKAQIGSAPPPFWNRHDRTVSAASNQSLLQSRGQQIQLEDHSEEHDSNARACWASHVSIDDYVVVGGASGIGAYVVWTCTVQTLKGAPFTIRKRYSEFDKLRSDLVGAFPHAEASIPPLPRKSVISRFRVKFLEQRKAGLSHFLSCILLNPEFAGSPILHAFIFDQ